MMKVNLLRVLFFVVLGVSSCWGQNKQWESMYSYYNTTTGIAYNETLIVAAENALFLYNPNLNSTETITTVDGLSGDNFSALVVYDNTIIAGFENGMVTKIDINTKKIDLDNSIERNISVNGDKKQINQLYVHQNLVYLATGFGIVELNPTTVEFGDTYYFGSLGARIRVNQVAVFEDYIYAATPQGVYRTLLNNPNKLEFSTWEQHAVGNWMALWMQDSMLYGARDEANAVSFFQLLDSITEKKRFSGKAKHIAPHENGIVITTSNRVYDVNKAFETTQTIADIDGVKPNTFTFGMYANNELWIGTSSSNGWHAFIKPIITNYPMNSGGCACRNTRMTRTCFGLCVIKMMVFGYKSFAVKSFKPFISKVVFKSGEVVHTHLVNNYTHNKFGF